jgi:hypothetical protein
MLGDLISDQYTVAIFRVKVTTVYGEVASYVYSHMAFLNTRCVYCYEKPIQPNIICIFARFNRVDATRPPHITLGWGGGGLDGTTA